MSSLSNAKALQTSLNYFEIFVHVIDERVKIGLVPVAQYIAVYDARVHLHIVLAGVQRVLHTSSESTSPSEHLLRAAYSSSVSTPGDMMPTRRAPDF